MYKITFYAPVENTEAVKNAMFKAGGGNIGDYSCCAWQTLGEGQFMPLAGSQPHIGAAFQLERVKEYKVDMVCSDAVVQDVVMALRSAHPYEEPAYQVIRLEDF